MSNYSYIQHLNDTGILRTVVQPYEHAFVNPELFWITILLVPITLAYMRSENIYIPSILMVVAGTTAYANLSGVARGIGAFLFILGMSAVILKTVYEWGDR